MEPRLASSVLAGALMRQAQVEGGSAAVLAKGDSQAGSILVILAEKGRKARIMERILQPGGTYQWQDSYLVTAINDEEAEKFLARRRKFDPDLWILELDIASAQRFADEMNAVD
jgi:hypothetical protein